ncbi:MAG: lysophospholipid acyltransferase family protein [Candidatus Omnitrophica bacterium]|nr:lysophospholipid acyltransferase family protein [Candidatus Omnitrophota bacterium]
MLYILYKIGFFILKATDTKGAYAIVSFFATLQYYVSKKDRETVKQNLRVVLPGTSEAEISLLAKNVFINFGKYLVDFFSPLTEDIESMKKKVVFDGIENIDKALKLGKGCIIVTGHFGNWELGGYLFAKLGYKLNVVALDHSDQRINSFFIEKRKRAGVNISSIGNAKQSCLSALKRNEIIAIVGDRPYGESGMDIQFFGKTAHIPRGAALFGIKTGAPIVITFVYKEDEKSMDYKMVFEKPVPITGEIPVHEQMRSATQYFINRFECYIREHPSQWYMFNRIWT